MRILLCLLSEQHVPNLLSVHHFDPKPDRLVLVETGEMKRRRAAEHLLKALEAGGLDYSDRCEIQTLEHEDSLPEVRRALQDAFGRHPSDEWIVNLTGGTKPMSIAAFMFFSVMDAAAIYLSGRQPNVIRWMDGSKVETCVYRPTVAEFLAGYGFPSRKPPEKVAEAEERARGWWALARVLAARSTAESLICFEDERERSKARDRGFALEHRHLEPRTLAVPDILRSIVEHFDLIEQDSVPTGKLDRYQTQFLLGGWLEVFIWGLLDRHHAALDIWDVRLGLEPTSPDAQVGNDFDVAFMHRYRLWMVECKTGSQEHDPGGDILYKVEAVIRQFRALHVRTSLATTSDFLTDPRTGTIREGHRNRASAYGCALVTRDQVRAMAEADDPVELLREALGLR
ncbi:Card1-like endonuclease domain-containing protein [Tautonia plasticadhaerens]|uniref:CRISPR-associated protein (Cas_Cas02710) n=1 Tax=Tautonia plasticadhaerens TaxID=2527974 RepID=A0A518GYM8_9BACT|nr:DUF1887 family CARF protein [Tautonia plasticadhaerens]QDV33704.1 CRISPR-associated protein (Cas_Cas02710) [Tautonia plasticadhaerens]